MEITDAVNNIIEHRRSIYTNMFSGEEVPDKIVNKMLENANWAPSHKQTEPWRFVVFKRNGLKKLAQFQADLYKEKSTGEGVFNEMTYEKLLNKPLECSHIIAIGMNRNPIVPEVEEVCATACAVQNMWLTASANNIGCYWSTGGITFYGNAKPFFGLGEDDQLLGFLYLGMPTTKWPAGRRKPVEDKVTWVED